MRLIFIACLATMFSCAPLAKFTYHAEDKVPAEIEFENQSKRATTYLWDFGDGNQSKDTDPKHHYVLSGNYQVTLEATKNGKTKQTTQSVYVEAPENCSVIIHTDLGNITIQLYDYTPEHRDNFIKLVEEGFYDGLLFHRVIEGFMIQGGDPDSKNAQKGQIIGMGGPGYTIPAEFNPDYVHVRGALASARLGGPSNPEKESSGSQFYIVQGSPVSKKSLQNQALKNGMDYTEEQISEYIKNGGAPQLDMEYTVFGRVIKGMDVVDEIAKVNRDQRNRPTQDIKMKMTVIK